MTHPVQTPPVPVWFLTLATAAIAVAALWYGRGLLLPLAIAGLLFVLGSAVDDQCRRLVVFGWSPPGWMSQLVTAVLVFAVLAVFSLVISSAAVELQIALPLYQERLAGLATRVESVLPPDLVAVVQGPSNSPDGSVDHRGAAQIGGGSSFHACRALSRLPDLRTPRLGG